MIQLVPPARGRITQSYGAKQSQDGMPHAGQDYGYYFNGVVTDEVFAAADGVVLFAGDSRTLGWPNLMYLNPDFNRNDSVDSSAGNYIIIQHHENKKPVALTGYAHLAAWSVKAGDLVKAGQRIGTIGNTGYSFGKHLHFDFMTYPLNYGTATYGRVDPNPYFVSGLAAAGATTTPAPEEIDMAAEDRLMAQLNQMVKWEDERYQDLKGKTEAALDHAARAAQVAQATEDRGDSAKIGLIFQMLAQIAPQFRFFKGPDDGTPESKTLYELDGGTLRGISFAEWQAKGGTEPVELPQEDIDKLLPKP